MHTPIYKNNNKNVYILTENYPNILPYTVSNVYFSNLFLK